MSCFTSAIGDQDAVTMRFMPDVREMVPLARAEELLGEVALEEFTHINLSNKSYADDAAVVIGKFMEKNCNKVRYANLADMIAGRMEEEALRALKSICDGLSKNELIELDLNDNAMGKPGVLACRSVLELKSLKKLYLCNDGLSGEAGEQLAEILLGGDGVAPLEALHYHNNMSGNEGAVAVGNIVSQLPQLTDFRFSTTRSKEAGCVAVAEALGGLPTNGFKHLNLSDNSFGGACLPHLATFMGKQVTTLQSVNFRDSGLGQKGLQMLVDALTGAEAPIKSLDLSGNDFEEESGEALGEVLASVKGTLEHLWVEDNCIESDAAVAMMKGLVGCTSLKTLNVSCCDLTAKGAYVVAAGACTIESFMQLDMDGNMVCESGVEAIIALVEKYNRALTEMEDNDDEGDDDLSEGQEEVDLSVLEAAGKSKDEDEDKIKGEGKGEGADGLEDAMGKLAV